MGLYERWTNSGEAGPKIPVHAFAAALRELTRGSVTKAQLVAAFALTSEDQTELDAIIATYQALPTSNAQEKAVVKLHDVMILCESGLYSKPKAKTELGF